MADLWDSIFAASNQGYFGSASPYGDPRDVFIDSVVDAGGSALATGQSVVDGFSGITVGTDFTDDYLVAYNGSVSEVDIFVGGFGADTFVVGDSFFGSYYTGASISVVADYNYFQGDVIQLSGALANGYTYEQGNFGMGNATVDTVIYFNGDPVTVLVDTPQFSFVYG
ncbi:MAG: hypothetical protein WBA10_01310 [Elainellaceae cyanobacterium]